MLDIELILICQSILPDKNRTKFNRVRFLCDNYRVHVVVKGEIYREAVENAVSVVRYPASLPGSLFFALAIGRIIRLGKRRRAVAYTTYEPINLLIGYAAKTLGRKWVADVWDDPEKLLMISRSLEGEIKERMLRLWRRTEFLVPKLVLRRADLCFTLMKHEIMGKYRVSEERIRATTNGVNLDIEYPEACRADGLFTLTYVGSMERVRIKEIPPLIERLSQEIGAFRVYLIGPDVKGGMGWLRERIRFSDPAVTIRIMGRLPHEEVLRILAGSDVSLCLYPNEADLNPAYPIKLFESMVMGKPVVATKLRGIREIVTDGVDGFLVEPGDIEAAAAVIARLKREPQLMKEVGERARNRAQEFDWKKIHAKLGRELDEFLAREMKEASRWT